MMHDGYIPALEFVEKSSSLSRLFLTAERLSPPTGMCVCLEERPKFYSICTTQMGGDVTRACTSDAQFASADHRMTAYRLEWLQVCVFVV